MAKLYTHDMQYIDESESPDTILRIAIEATARTGHPVMAVHGPGEVDVYTPNGGMYQASVYDNAVTVDSGERYIHGIRDDTRICWCPIPPGVLALLEAHCARVWGEE